MVCGLVQQVDEEVDEIEEEEWSLFRSTRREDQRVRRSGGKVPTRRRDMIFSKNGVVTTTKERWISGLFLAWMQGQCRSVTATIKNRDTRTRRL